MAAIGGHAIGGGLELALSCDLRICSAEARLGMPPARLGLVYSHTGLRKFIDAIGAPRTRELFFTARNVPAHEALAWGLVAELAPPDGVAARAVEVAAGIAANAPLSLRGNKAVIRALLAAEGELDPATEAELVALREACFRTEDFLEGVQRVRREAGAALDGPLSAACHHGADEAFARNAARRRPARAPPAAAAAMPLDPVPEPVVEWRDSRAAAARTRTGGLVRGVMLPDEGRDFFTWDPINRMSPNREWRRWGTDRLVRTLLDVLDALPDARTRGRRGSGSATSRGPTAGTSGASTAGSGTCRTRTASTPTSTTRAATAASGRAGAPRLVDQRLVAGPRRPLRRRGRALRVHRPAA